MKSTPCFAPLHQVKATQKRVLLASARHAQLGLTLVELMVAMAIGMFILIAIALVYSSAKTGFTYANNTARISEDASFAIDSLSRDIRMASYAGCAGLSKVATAGLDTILGTADDGEDTKPKLDNVRISAVLADLTGAKKPNPFSTSTSDPTGKTAVFHASNAVQGFPGGASTAAADARTALGTSTSYTVSTTPILYVAGGAAQAVPLSAIAAAASTTVTLASDTYKWNNNPTNTVMLIADCKNSEMFRAASTTTTGVITTETPLLNAYGSDAIVTPLLTSTYFLATRTGASTPSLYRRYFNGNTSTVEELVPNVEAITFQYGLNTTNDPLTGNPTYQPDSYVLDTDAAFATMDWSRVVSVRMGLIVVTEDANQTSSNGGTVPWVGGNYTPASSTDRRLRRAYSTTVSIRNRMGL